jgi:hypothetical protein
VQGSFNIEFNAWTQQNCIDFRDGVIYVTQLLLTNFNANQDVSPCVAVAGSTIATVTINKVPGTLATTFTSVFNNASELRSRFVGTSLAGATFTLAAVQSSPDTSSPSSTSKAWIAAVVIVPLLVIGAIVLVYFLCFKNKNAAKAADNKVAPKTKDEKPVDVVVHYDKAPSKTTDDKKAIDGFLPSATLGIIEIENANSDKQKPDDSMSINSFDKPTP